MLYFHGNAEDLGLNDDFLKTLRAYYKMSILAMEYPGYGFHSHRVLNNADMSKKLSCSAK